MLGGTQGFMSNATCRKEHRALNPLAPSRAACLELDDTTGIRLSRGRGLPWSTDRWAAPRVVLTGVSPTNCVDRRPAYTGYPRLNACEFDGRLSLAQTASGSFLLYSRANLKFGAVAGGRFVQVTKSDRLDGGWTPWQPVQILGVDSDKMDIYTFAVQRNPVDGSSLLAVFPLTEPPWACIVIAVSIDGIKFSRPVTLRSSPFGVRPSYLSSGEHPPLEWRGEDHPCSGILRAPGDPNRILIYVHHAVKGTTIRKDAVPHVRVYSVLASELQRETAAALATLQ